MKAQTDCRHLTNKKSTIQRGDWVAIRNGDWELAKGLVGRTVGDVMENGWRVCRPIAIKEETQTKKIKYLRDSVLYLSAIIAANVDEKKSNYPTIKSRVRRILLGKMTVGEPSCSFGHHKTRSELKRFA